MASNTRPRPALSDAEMAALLPLLDQADSVELKVTVPESQQRSAIAALGLDPLDAQVRQVFFFDTPDLTLDRAGVVVRARRVQRKGDDSVVKLRPVVPNELAPKLRRAPGFGVEVDAMPGGFVCSGSLKRAIGPGDAVRRVAAGARPVRKLFSKEQRALFAAHAPDGVELDDLAVLGPIFVLKLRFSPPGYGHRLVAELWLYPDDSRIVELSTKCLAADAFRRAVETRVLLGEHGLDLGGEQQTKTRKALKFFARRAAAESSSA